MAVMAALCLLVLSIAFLVLGLLREGAPVSVAPDGGAIPMAVLGDSDSHSYQDRVSFGSDRSRRGGEFRAQTFQWTEVLARLRGEQLDLGEWGGWGEGPLLSRLKERFGGPVRSPRREDYRYNFSVSGAGCEALNERPQRQVFSLLSVMAQDPERWRRGIVVIRIGVNNIGQAEHLDRLARDPEDSFMLAEMDWCIGHIAKAIRRIREVHPELGIVVVGGGDNSNWPRLLDRWHTAREIANIRTALEAYDARLRTEVQRFGRVAFFDDRAWFARLWGERNEDGLPEYRSVRIGTDLEVWNRAGDAPHNTVLADGHAGLAWNTLWAQSLIDLMNSQLGTDITPIASPEVEGWIQGVLGPDPVP
jgi:hypothetical protein